MACGGRAPHDGDDRRARLVGQRPGTTQHFGIYLAQRLIGTVDPYPYISHEKTFLLKTCANVGSE